MSYIVRTFLAASIAFLVACGGGGDSGTPLDVQAALLREQSVLLAQINRDPPPANVNALIDQFNANVDSLKALKLNPPCGTQKGREAAFLVCIQEYAVLTTKLAPKP